MRCASPFASPVVELETPCLRFIWRALLVADSILHGVIAFDKYSAWNAETFRMVICIMSSSGGYTTATLYWYSHVFVFSLAEAVSAPASPINCPRVYFERSNVRPPVPRTAC